MKEWHTLQDFVGLPGLPGTYRGILKKAQSLGWESQHRAFGKGLEYHISNLPREAREELQQREMRELLPRLHEQPGADLRPGIAYTDAQTERQRAVADARVTVLQAIHGLCGSGATQEAAIQTLLTQGETGQLAEINPVLDHALRMAKDPRGRSNSNYPSRRSLLRWLACDTKKLAPKGKRPPRIPTWANEFLKHWQRPEKPSIQHAHRQMVAQWSGEQAPPSLSAVRRFIAKMGTVSRQKGRMGSRELKSILPFVRRDFDQLLPADIYSADGHTFDAEVQHPGHARPFRPEVTTFIDVATRKVVGVSVDLAESSIAVLDALISSCSQSVPAILYVDNGSGYANSLLQDKATGVLARLGCTVVHSLPYSSQARGVVERVHQTLWVDAAQALPGFIGKPMDKEAKDLQHKVTRQAVKNGGPMPLLAWPEFMEYINQRIQWYNARPHCSLPKITDQGGKRRHQTPDELWQQHIDAGWVPVTLTGDEAAHVFRPREIRQVRRGEVQIFNNRYFSTQLTEWHGQDVHVAYDVRDPQWVWIYNETDGRFICRAEWNANHVDYMPKSRVEQARADRAKGRARRLELRLDEVQAELRGGPALEHGDSLPGIGSISAAIHNAQISQTVEPEPVLVECEQGVVAPGDLTPGQRFALYQEYENGKPVPDEHQFWFGCYPKSKEYGAWSRRNNHLMGNVESEGTSF